VIDGVQFDGWYGRDCSRRALPKSRPTGSNPHTNDDGEWMTRYGAAIALEDCAA
jgi:hypothetical protein